MDSMTVREQEAAREERLNEVGAEPPCPFCRRPRVAGNTYTRCNPCGVNWLDEEMGLPDYLNRDPRVCRSEAARMATGTKPTVEPRAADVEGFTVPGGK
jgi:hypothetical protein